MTDSKNGDKNRREKERSRVVVVVQGPRLLSAYEVWDQPKARAGRTDNDAEMDPASLRFTIAKRSENQHCAFYGRACKKTDSKAHVNRTTANSICCATE